MELPQHLVSTPRRLPEGFGSAPAKGLALPSSPLGPHGPHGAAAASESGRRASAGPAFAVAAGAAAAASAPFSEELPPSLAVGSSSPFFDSPRTERNHNRVLTPYLVNSYAAFSPTPDRGTDSAAQRLAHLSSSPPETTLLQYSAGGAPALNVDTVWDPSGPPAGPGATPVPGSSLQRRTLGSSYEFDPSAAQKRRDSTAAAAAAPIARPASAGVPAPARALAPAPSIGLSEFLSPKKLRTRPAKRSRRRRKLAKIASSEYSIMGSGFGFVISAAGRAEFLELRLKRPLGSATTDLASLLGSDDSDSEPEGEWERGEQYAGSGDAVSEFARVAARSRLDSAKRARYGSAAPEETPRMPDTAFFSVPVHRDDAYQFPQTPRSHGNFRNNISLGTGTFNSHLVTPPGAAFTMEGTPHMYNTGMTPYIPQH